MNDKQYNGWTNYETWAVKLWMDNDEGAQRHYAEAAQDAYDNAEGGKVYASQTRKENAACSLADILKDEHEERASELGLLDGAKTGVFSDLFGAALSEVNWYEIAESLLDEVDETASA